MKNLAIAVGLVVLSLGMVAGAVFGLGDDEILVSPPESVAQEFVRAVSLGQAAAAREMLSRDAKGRTPTAEVHRMSEDLRARVGRLEEVNGTVTKRLRDTAVVRVAIQGEQGKTEASLVLVRETGEWAISRGADVFKGHR